MITLRPQLLGALRIPRDTDPGEKIVWGKNTSRRRMHNRNNCRTRPYNLLRPYLKVRGQALCIRLYARCYMALNEDKRIWIRGLDNYQVELPVATSEMDTLDTSGSDSDSDESTTSSRSVRFGAEIMG